METQGSELTNEDILNIHRHYITSLYVDEKKTDTEIVHLLHEHSLSVTVQQIQKCIRDWHLVQDPQSSPTNNTPVSTEYATLDDWELTSSPQPPVSSFTPRTAPNAIFTPTAAPDLHCKPALLALPPHPQTPKNGKRKCDISSLSSNQDRLKLTCHHGPGPTELHEVEVPLNALPSHPDDLSPLESYAEDLEQTHERIAMGLERIPSHALLKMGLVGFRRAADTTKKSTRTRRVLATPRCRSGRGRRDVPDRDGEGEGKEEKEKEKTPPL